MGPLLIGADSVTAANLLHLPVTPDFFIAYADGWYNNWAAVTAEHPGVPVIGLTVYLSPGTGDGTDSEPFDATIAQAVTDTQGELARGVWRPVVYCPASWARAMVAAHSAAGIARARYRLVTAHYGAGEHICGPTTCGYLDEPADGTQWTDWGTWDQTTAQPDFLNVAYTPPPPGGNVTLNCVDAAATPSGAGYWFANSDGSVDAEGDAVYYGGVNPGAKGAPAALGGPIVAIVATPTGKGYWLFGSDKGVYAFGDAHFFGTPGAS